MMYISQFQKINHYDWFVVTYSTFIDIPIFYVT